MRKNTENEIQDRVMTLLLEDKVNARHLGMGTNIVKF